MTAREAALAALERCRKTGAWSSALLEQSARSLDRREAALAAQLLLGVLQNRSYCDYAIGLYSRTPANRLDPKLLNILRLGAYQILFLDKIPPHAAVSETVALCRSAGCERAAGLCNAVLRRLAENRDKLPPVPGEGSAAYLATRWSYPLWLSEQMVERHGYSFAEAFFRAGNQPPETDLQLNTLKIDRESYLRSLQRLGIAYTVPPWPENCVSLRGGRVTELPGYEEGLFYVQDRAARMAVQIAAPKPGMDVLDACAAPGGKSFAAAIAMGNRGSILACDIHEKKLRLIRSGAERLGLTLIETQVRDARESDPMLTSRFDLVIADVPCSGLGVIRKKPEIRWKTPEELRDLPAIQGAILDSLCSCVKPGGRLLYATCTILEVENQQVVHRFLQEHDDFALEPFRVGERDYDGGMANFWPQIDGTDGFFAALLKRKL